MNGLHKQAHFDQLRKQYGFFVFQKYSIQHKNGSLNLKFNFNLANQFFFEPQIHIPARDYFKWDIIPPYMLERLVFHIGMVELVSYWKASCAPLVIIKPFHLNSTQIAWWKKLYFHGLGEFFFLNGIQTDINNFMELQSDSGRSIIPCEMQLDRKAIVPVGGGKDSVVTLELLNQQEFDYLPFIINPRKASRNCALTAGYKTDELAIADRTIDPLLLRLNEKGFLNGHTPFSALLAFVSAMVAVGTQSKYIVLSNESSANEATVMDTMINHQYSKSIEFERDFRGYTRQYLHSEMDYFSLLRPLNELQIGKLFSKQPAYFPHFRSCNVGSKTDSWCCNCPKCLFTWLMLAPFVKPAILETIFGENLLTKRTLIPILHQLTGNAETKPFECVGTVREVKSAVSYLLNQYRKDPPLLLQNTGMQQHDFEQTKHAFDNILAQFDETHYVPDYFLQKLKEVLND